MSNRSLNHALIPEITEFFTSKYIASNLSLIFKKKKKNCQSIEGYSLPFFFESLIFESSNLPLQNLISTVHNLSRRKIPPSNLLSNFETAFGPRNCVWPRDITLYATWASRINISIGTLSTRSVGEAPQLIGLIEIQTRPFLSHKLYKIRRRNVIAV